MPFASPIVIKAASMTRDVGLAAPASMACASPVATMAPARYSGFFNNRAAMASVIFPRRERSSAISLASAGGTSSPNTIGFAIPCASIIAAALRMRSSPPSGMTMPKPLPRIACFACSIVSRMEHPSALPYHVNSYCGNACKIPHCRPAMATFRFKVY